MTGRLQEPSEPQMDTERKDCWSTANSQDPCLKLTGRKTKPHVFWELLMGSVKRGDTIQVTLHNNISSPEDGTALHWHGITQKASPLVDIHSTFCIVPTILQMDGRCPWCSAMPYTGWKNIYIHFHSWFVWHQLVSFSLLCSICRCMSSCTHSSFTTILYPPLFVNAPYFYSRDAPSR